MRTIIVVLFLLLYTIVSLPMYLIGFILGKMDPKKKVRMSQRFVAGGFRCILFLSGVKVTVKGKENQIHDKAALYVFNHRSFFDIVVGDCANSVCICIKKRDCKGANDLLVDEILKLSVLGSR